MSIGLPVYNGERYLEEAVQSILAQTYTDFELIICDNASTDSTAEICARLAAADDRIRYFRNPENIGGAKNHNLTFSYARGKYFRWAGHDDTMHPELLERLVQVLDTHPDVVLAQSYVMHIDENGEPVRLLMRNRPANESRAHLFASLTDMGHWCEDTYGLMRADVLAQTGLLHLYTDGDRTLLAHMALMGRYFEVPEPLFFRRLHPESSVNTYPEWRSRMVWFGNEYATKITLPHWMQLRHYLQVIVRTPNDLRTKLECLAFMAVWITRYNRWRSLAHDIVLALQALVHNHGRHGRALA